MSKPISHEYMTGVAAAMEKLAAWEIDKPSPQSVAAELRAGIFVASLSKRTGYSETIAAYLLCALDGSLPIMGAWPVLDELCGAAAGEVSHE